jgi:hypothetical protein
MSIQRRRTDRAAAERLLRGTPTAPATGPEPLASLLAAAAAPGRPDELAGEHAAVVAFRMAHRPPATQPRSRSMIRTAVGKVLTAKAAAVLAATTIGGVAVAASTGNLPTQHGGSPSPNSSHSAAATSHPTPTQTGEAPE